MDDAFELKAALAIKPGDLNIHYSLGMVYIEKGEYDLAIKELELANAKEFVEYVKKDEMKQYKGVALTPITAWYSWILLLRQLYI